MKNLKEHDGLINV